MLLLIKKKLFIFLILLLVLQSSTGIVLGDTNMTIVADVLSLKVSLSMITPEETMQEENKIRLISTDHLSWLLDKRAQSLLAIVEERVFAEYARTNGIEPSERDLGEYRTMKERASAELLSILKQKIAEARQELTMSNISESRRKELLIRLRILETHPLFSTGGQKSSDDRDKEIAEAHLFMRNRIINRQLFKQYGGRIKLNLLGFPEAIDARKHFLEDSENRGDFQIYDKELRQRMWQLLNAKENGTILEGKVAEKAMLGNEGTENPEE